MERTCTFISIEGGEGVGKTTLLEKLKVSLPTFLPEKDFHFIKDPDVDDICGDIRGILLSSKNTNISPVTELMLYLAARAQLVYDKIVPHFNDPRAVIISDRFDTSTLAYQTRNPGIDKAMITSIQQQMACAHGYCCPDLTLLMDIDPEIGVMRSRERLGQDNVDESRFEEMDLSVHYQLRENYKCCALEDDDREYKIYDCAFKTPEIIHTDLLDFFRHYITRKDLNNGNVR